MQILRSVPVAAPRAAALTIGNFDGVHVGHQAMLARLLDAARAKGLEACAMTFEPHPREFFAPDKAPTRLTSLREKLELLRAAGLDRTYVMRFDYRFAQIAAEDFIGARFSSAASGRATCSWATISVSARAEQAI